VFDRGFLFGDGVYETVRTYATRPFRLAAHLDRLGLSAGRLGIRVPPGIPAAVGAVLRANRLAGARVRIVLTRGSGSIELADPGSTRPTVLVYAVPYSPPPESAYRDGVTAIIPAIVRNDRRALDPAIKSLNLLNAFLAVKEARRHGAREAIMLNTTGRVAEAAAANVFFVRRGVLCTPALESGILPGITRDLVLDLARRLGFPVKEAMFPPRDLGDAEEAFVTASTIEILPLARIGGRGYARRYPVSRPYTRALMTAYRVTVEDETGA
jgi:branched-chain amino acid aminotransferase